MNVWALFPTALADHAPAIFEKWKAKGYKIGLFVDPGKDHPCDLLIRAEYPGVWRAWNALAKAAVAMGADVCVLVGDDMEPDPNNTAEEIAKTYFERFPGGFGVMQPSGDPQGKDENGVPAAARICGSPWVGREWVIQGYVGNGPVNGIYNAFYADEELKHVAERRGVLWMRPDLQQFHRHWSFGFMERKPYHERNQQKWLVDKNNFESRLLAGFP